MRKRDRRELGDYVRAIADQVGLRDWTIELQIGEPADDSPAFENAMASIECVDGRKYALITVTHALRDEPREDLRDTICHELIHAHLNAACEVVRVDIREWFPQATHILMFEGYRRLTETAVDALAGAVAPHMPLIEWPS
jgi:hypothetical protein